MAEPRIRFAEREDAAAVGQMVLELLQHLGDPLEPFDADRFVEDAFGTPPQFSLLVAEVDGELLGYALYHDAYEPSHAARGVYLCDLYVRGAFRRRGVGHKLVAAVAQDTAMRGRQFVWWVVRAGNGAALEFYRKLTEVEEPVVAMAVAYDGFDDLVASTP